MARKRKRKIFRLALGASGEALAGRPLEGRRGPVGQRVALGLLAAFLSVSVGPRAWAAEQTQTFQIAASADDGHERNDGSVFLTNQTITVGENRIPGFRFPGVPIPAGSLILSAKLRMYATADVNRTIAIEYRAEASDSSAPFTSANYSFSQRALGANLVQDAPAAWIVSAYNESPDLKLLLQEVVDRPGWAAGNALSLFIRNNGGNNVRTIASKDNTANKPPELVVTWEPSPPPKTITVTGPNGGETWPLGSTQVVTWTSTNYIPSVKIDLSRNSGTTWETLAASEPNDGIFPWLVQGSDTTAAMVRVSSATAPSIADASDATFSITPQTVPTTSLFQITQGLDDGHERSDGSLALGIQTITLGVNRKGGFRFQNVQIPQGASIVSAKLRLYATADVNHSVSFQYKAEAADNSAAFAETVNNFTNRALTAAVVYETPAPWVQNAYAETVDLSPVVQEVVSRPGWVLGNALSLFILDNAGADQRTIASKDNSANKPPELSVTWTTGTPPPQVRSISVVSPTSGDTWEVGLKKDIRWSSTGSISQVMIEISRDNGTTWEVLSPAEQNDGLFTWPAVTGPPTTLAVVRVSDTTAPSTFGTSSTASPFVIADNPESITVTAPNGGESWPATTAQVIRWTWTGGIQKVKVEVSRDGGATWELITQNANNDGDSNWTATGPETTNALIRVSAMDGSASDVSDAPFGIGAAPPPPPPPPPEPKTITVSLPNGGDAWLIGNQQPIKWTSTGSIANVKIELSRDAGATWEVVAASEVNDGTFTWGNVTGPDSFSCLVRISDASDATVRDTSNGVFSIVSQIQGVLVHLDGEADTGRDLILSQASRTKGRVEAIGRAYPTAGIVLSFVPDTGSFGGGVLGLTTDLTATTIPTATTLTLPEDPAMPGFSIPFLVFATQTSEGYAFLKAEYGAKTHTRRIFVTSETKTISPRVCCMGQDAEHTVVVTGPGVFPGGAAPDGTLKVFPPDGVSVAVVSTSPDLKTMVVRIKVDPDAKFGKRIVSIETRRQFDPPNDGLGGTQVKAQQVIGELNLIDAFFVDIHDAEIDRILPISADLFDKAIFRRDNPTNLGPVSSPNPFGISFVLDSEPSPTQADQIAVTIVRHDTQVLITEVLTETGDDTRLFRDPAGDFSLEIRRPITILSDTLDGPQVLVESTRRGLEFSGRKYVLETSPASKTFKEFVLHGDLQLSGPLRDTEPDTVAIKVSTLDGLSADLSLLETGPQTLTFKTIESTATLRVATIQSFQDDTQGLHDDAVDLIAAHFTGSVAGREMQDEPLSLTETGTGSLRFVNVVTPNQPVVRAGYGAEFVPDLDTLKGNLPPRRYFIKILDAEAADGDTIRLTAKNETGATVDMKDSRLAAIGAGVFRTERPTLSYGGLLTPAVASELGQTDVLLSSSDVNLEYKCYPDASPVKGRRSTVVITAVGNSITAGTAHATTVESSQQDAYPALIAAKMDVPFGLPLIKPNGLPTMRTTFNVPAHQVELRIEAPAPGSRKDPSNEKVHNFAVPGTEVAEIVRFKGTADEYFLKADTSLLPEAQREPIASEARLPAEILQGIGTQAEQALAKRPDLVLVWAGNNDALEILTTEPFGEVVDGTGGDIRVDRAYGNLTTLDAFRSRFVQLLDSIQKPVRGKTPDILVANIPNIPVIPHLLTLGKAPGPFPFEIAQEKQEKGTRHFEQKVDTRRFLEGFPIPTRRKAGTEHPPDSKISITAYFAAINQDPPRFTFEDSEVLSPAELKIISDRIEAFNGFIGEECGRRKIPVVDIFAFFNDVVAKRRTLKVGATTLDASLAGGLFSYDAIHPSKTGHAFIANEFIDRINTEIAARGSFAGFKGPIPRFSEAEIGKIFDEDPLHPRNRPPAP